MAQFLDDIGRAEGQGSFELSGLDGFVVAVVEVEQEILQIGVHGGRLKRQGQESGESEEQGGSSVHRAS